jgi:hypothetical protein
MSFNIPFTKIEFRFGYRAEKLYGTKMYKLSSQVAYLVQIYCIITDPGIELNRFEPLIHSFETK